MVWSAIALALLMSFFPDWVINLLYGSQYDQTGKVLMILVWANIFVFYGAAKGSCWIITENLQRFGLICTVSGAFSNIILNYLLIDRYGNVGAAFATILSHLIASVIFPLLYNKDRISVIMFIKTFNILKYRGIK